MNYYFEIEQEDGINKYEKSKKHRPNPIIQMGLFTDGDGIYAVCTYLLDDDAADILKGNGYS